MFMTLADELRELKQLHTEGVLTNQEFTDAKAAVTQQAASDSSVLKKKVRCADPPLTHTRARSWGGRASLWRRVSAAGPP